MADVNFEVVFHWGSLEGMEGAAVMVMTAERVCGRRERVRVSMRCVGFMAMGCDVMRGVVMSWFGV